MSKHLSAAFFILSFFFFFNVSVQAAILPVSLNDLTNQERSQAGLNTLQASDTLARSAQLKANDMAAKSYFEHSSPEGYSFFYWIDKAGYGYTMAGENLAIYFTDSDKVVEAWMNSPTHKENILRSGFTEVGSAVAEGVYQGHPTIFVVQHYGNPKSAPIPIPIPVPAPAPVAIQAPAQVASVLEQTPKVIASSKVASRAKSVETTKPLEVKSEIISSVPVVAGPARLAYGGAVAGGEKVVEKENKVTISRWRTLLRGFISLISRDKLFL